MKSPSNGTSPGSSSVSSQRACETEGWTWMSWWSRHFVEDAQCEGGLGIISGGFNTGGWFHPTEQHQSQEHFRAACWLVSGLSFHGQRSHVNTVCWGEKTKNRLFSFCCCPLLLLCDCHVVHHTSNDPKAFGHSPQISLQLLAEAQAGYRFIHFKWDCLAHLKFSLAARKIPDDHFYLIIQWVTWCSWRHLSLSWMCSWRQEDQ